MKKTYYKLKDNHAVARANNCPISIKFSAELARELRSKHYKQAIKYLDDIVALKRHVPLLRHNNNVAHRKGPAVSGVKSGRYPVKASKYFKKVLEMAKANADYKGLESDKKDLIIRGFVVSQGIKRYNFQTKGRRRLRRPQTTNLEVVLAQQGKFVKKKIAEKASTKEKVSKKIVSEVKKETKPEMKKVESEKGKETVKEKQRETVKQQKVALNKEMQKRQNL